MPCTAEEGAGGTGVLVGSAAEELALEDDAVVVAPPGADRTPAGPQLLPPPPAQEVPALPRRPGAVQLREGLVTLSQEKMWERVTHSVYGLYMIPSS